MVSTLALHLCHRLLHPIRHFGPHINYSLEQVVDDLGSRLFSNALDLVQLLLRVLVCLLFGCFVSGGVLWACMS